MNTDRSIRLDVSVPDLRSGAGQGGPSSGAGRQGKPDDQAQQRFQQALSTPPNAAPPAAGSAVPQPFALFGGLAQSTPATPSPVSAAMPAYVDNLLAQLMVGEGRSG